MKNHKLKTQGDSLAPIIIFVYNRVDHVRAVIEALLQCHESENSILYIYSDAAKSDYDKEGVNLVREYVSRISGFKEIRIIKQKKNLGIERSEITGIKDVIDRHGKAIILEDDIVVGPYFLRFINDALEKYREKKEVISITGYSFLRDDEARSLPEYSFVQLTSAWGWATWEDRWQLFCNDIGKKEVLSLCNKQIRTAFNHGGNYADMMYHQYLKKAFTWDLCWYWTSFSNNKYTLAPTLTMVNNIGMDGSGVHYNDKTQINRIEAIETREYSGDLPEVVELDEKVDTAITNALINQSAQNEHSSNQIEIIDVIKWAYRSIVIQLQT